MRAITITEQETEAQVDDTAFLDFMGKSPFNKVVDFLIENDRTSWTMKDISVGRNVGYSTLKLLLPRMLERGVIVVDRVVGNIRFYKINNDNKVVRCLYKIYRIIDEQVMHDFVIGEN